MAEQGESKLISLKNTIQEKISGSGLLKQLTEFLSSNKVTIGLVIAGLAFIALIGFFFRDYFDKEFKKKAGVEDENPPDTCEIIFFYTTWCPYCKKARSNWQDFSSQWNGKKAESKQGKRFDIIMSEVDCDRQEAIANKFNVTGYPSIKCIMNGKVTDFDASPTPEALNQFLQVCLGN
jgi:thiol-disulfide isomerase/thioredoxin